MCRDKGLSHGKRVVPGNHSASCTAHFQAVSMTWVGRAQGAVVSEPQAPRIILLGCFAVWTAALVNMGAEMI